MPSRKKAKGKARRAAKAEGKVEKTKVPPSDYSAIRSLDDWLTAFDSEEIKCTHGCEISPALRSRRSEHDCLGFVLQYASEFLVQICHLTGGSFADPTASSSELVDKCMQQSILFSKEVEAMTVKYSKVFEDLDKLKWAISFYHSRGAQDVMDGNMKRANLAAMCAEFMNAYLIESETSEASQVKMNEMLFASDKIIFNYFRRRIPCSCLDDKREQFKGAKKTVKCCNSSCPLPQRDVECRKLLYCSGCNVVHYCSPQCQKVDWKHHKLQCSQLAKMISDIR